jgi:hypothetical protein|tara:strand:+ start:6544 stop:6888 length:345 start_codon:yes stop_codon:yes gene_type:complete
MFDVWIAKEVEGKYEPVTKVPQHHKNVEEAFECASRMMKLMGADVLEAKNIHVRGVDPTGCILIFDPSGNPRPNNTDLMATLVVGGTLIEQDSGKTTYKTTGAHPITAGSSGWN